MDKQESSLRKFGTVTHQLLTESHPSVAETLNRALRDVNIKWGQSNHSNCSHHCCGHTSF